MEHLAWGACDFLEEVQSVAVVKGLIIAVITRVCFLQQKRPNFYSLIVLNLCGVDVIRPKDSIIMLNDRYIVIYDRKLPYIFLEYLDQVYPEIVALVGFEHLAQDASAIFYAVEGLTYEIVAVVLACYQKIAFLVGIGDC